jgi:hypothetical protein
MNAPVELELNIQMMEQQVNFVRLEIIVQFALMEVIMLSLEFQLVNLVQLVFTVIIQLIQLALLFAQLGRTVKKEILHLILLTKNSVKPELIVLKQNFHLQVNAHHVILENTV